LRQCALVDRRQSGFGVHLEEQADVASFAGSGFMVRPMRTILLRTAPAAGSDLLTRELRRDRARAFEVQRPNQRRAA